MIVIAAETQYSQDAIDLLTASVVFTHSLYEEEKYHAYDLKKIDEFFVIRKSGQAIGCGAYSWAGEYIVEIKHIFVYDTARGLGCGRLLMQTIEDAVKEAGAEQIILETTLKQKEAIGLYEKFGYTYITPYKEKMHDEQIFMLKKLYESEK